MNVSIVGMGLIGASYARSLREEAHHITGIDINQETLEFALKEGYVDAISTNPKELLANSEVVFVCLYPEQAVNFIKEHKEYFQKGAIVSDVAGVKDYMMKELPYQEYPNIELVFAHPIAGRESKGIHFSSDTVFKGANFIITPHEGNTECGIGVIEIFAQQMGFKNISRMTAKEHDSIIAYTSQLVHVLALALMNSDDDEYDTNKYIGDSYKGLTRIMNVNEPLWAELFLQNREALLKRIEGFETVLTKFKASMESNDETEIIRLLTEAKRRRGDL